MTTLAHTFLGRKYRARLTAYDATGPEIPEDFRKSAVIYTVEVLAQELPKQTSFSNGQMVYRGESSALAWQKIQEYCGDAPLRVPPKIRQCLNI